MKANLVLVSLVAAVLVTGGCARFLVPVTRISGSINNQPFSVETPKDTDLTNLMVTASNSVTTISIGGMKTRMNPDVITMSGETFVNSVNAVGSQVGNATGKGAQAAVKP